MEYHGSAEGGKGPGKKCPYRFDGNHDNNKNNNNHNNNGNSKFNNNDNIENDDDNNNNRYDKNDMVYMIDRMIIFVNSIMMPSCALPDLRSILHINLHSQEKGSAKMEDAQPALRQTQQSKILITNRSLEKSARCS